MPQILLVNPSPRARLRRIAEKPINRKETKMATRKKTRTAAQRAATAKLVKLNKTRRVSKRPASVARPARRVARVAKTVRRRSAHRISSAKAASSAGRVLRYRRPNPMSFVADTLLPSAVGGVGALALDIAIGALPLPAALKAGPMAPLVKLAGAVGLGMLAGATLGRKTGEQVAAGALTVAIYNFSRAALVKLGGGKIPGLSLYPDGPMGEFVSGADVLELGYTDSGTQVGGDDYSAQMNDGYAMNGYESGVYR